MMELYSGKYLKSWVFRSGPFNGGSSNTEPMVSAA